MSVKIKQDVDTNSREFNEGVEAGLNSARDTKNWKAGNELGQALKEEEGGTKRPIPENPIDESTTLLFLRDSPGSNKGNAQDEKDERGE